MARFTEPADMNYSPSVVSWAVVAQAKLKLRGGIVCQLDSSFTQLGRSGVMENMAKLRRWQIATVIRCSLRWKIESKRWHFRRSAAALTIIRSRKPRTLHSQPRATSLPPATSSRKWFSLFLGKRLTTRIVKFCSRFFVGCASHAFGAAVPHSKTCASEERNRASTYDTILYESKRKRFYEGRTASGASISATTRHWLNWA